jgi:hypothetical protein
MPDPQNTGVSSSPPTPNFDAIPGHVALDEGDLQARTLQQAKSELPQPQLAAPWEQEPRLDVPPTTRLGKAYNSAKAWLGEHEQHLSDRVLKPFREGLNRMGNDLQQAAGTGHTKTGGQLTTPIRLLLGGVGTLLHQVPVGSNVSETVQALATPPELGPEGKAALKTAQTAEGVFWHGSPSGDLRGGKSGLHVGTKEAAKQALEARIGIPADGKGWSGDREYVPALEDL